MAAALLVGSAGLSRATPPAPPTLACPATLGGKPLEGASLFDGPPADQAELAPDASSGRINRWLSLKTAQGPLVLVCRFRGRPDPLEVKLPAGVASCVSEVGPGGRGLRSFACRT